MTEVAVAGSLHLDIMVAAPRLPQPDETLMGSAWHYKCGGKGGNQAVAAARFGAATAFGGAVGRDDFGARLRANLEACGVGTRCLTTVTTHSSGMSVAIIEENGDYGAVVVSGANQAIDATRIGDDWASLWTCRVLLLQNEVAEAVNLAAARSAKTRGARVVLNAAPARAIAPDLLALADLLIVNRIEARMLTGAEDAAAALAKLHAPGRDVIVTRGADGVSIMERNGAIHTIPAYPVRQLSSHGAGDCFCGALAARLAAGDALIAACGFAAAAAALFVATPETKQSGLGAARVREFMAGTAR